MARFLAHPTLFNITLWDKLRILHVVCRRPSSSLSGLISAGSQSGFAWRWGYPIHNTSDFPRSYTFKHPEREQLVQPPLVAVKPHHLSTITSRAPPLRLKRASFLRKCRALCWLVHTEIVCFQLPLLACVIFVGAAFLPSDPVMNSVNNFE